MYELKRKYETIGYYTFFKEYLFFTVKNGFKIVDDDYLKVIVHYDQNKSYNTPVSTNKFLCFTDNEYGSLVVVNNNFEIDVIQGAFGSFGNKVVNDYTVLSYEKTNKKHVSINLSDKSVSFKNFDFTPSLFIDDKFAIIYAGINVWCYDSNTNLVWHIILDNFKSELPEWEIEHEDHKGIKCKSEITHWNNSLIFSMGQTIFEQRFISIDISTGQLNWIAKEYKATGIYHIYNNKAYTLYGKQIMTVNLFDGTSELLDISGANEKSKIELIYNFNMRENFILGVQDKTLKFGVFNVDTMRYDFVHQFRKGKDIDKNVSQLELPRMNNEDIYIQDSESTLHIFQKSNDLI